MLQCIKNHHCLCFPDKVPPRPPMPRDLAPPRPPPPETDTEDEEAFPTPQANQPIMVKISLLFPLVFEVRNQYVYMYKYILTPFKYKTKA